MVFRTPHSLSTKRVAVDFAIAVASSVLGLLTDEGVFGGPVSRGFFRNDESIRHPYKDNETVSTALLIVLTFIVPLILIPIIDAVANRGKPGQGLTQPRGRLGTIHRVGVFWVGYGLCVFFTALIKDTVGRLRPDFIDRCQPNYGSIPDSVEWIYASSDVCTGEAAVVEKGRRSFPSGHSSVAFYGLVFLAVYIAKAVPRQQQCSNFCILLLQTPFVAVATFIAASRTSDYAHHAGDVIAGSLLGLGFVAMCFVYLLKDHEADEKQKVDLVPSADPESGQATAQPQSVQMAPR